MTSSVPFWQGDKSSTGQKSPLCWTAGSESQHQCAMQHQKNVEGNQKGQHVGCWIGQSQLSFLCWWFWHDTNVSIEVQPQPECGLAAHCQDQNVPITVSEYRIGQSLVGWQHNPGNDLLNHLGWSRYHGRQDGAHWSAAKLSWKSAGILARVA